MTRLLVRFIDWILGIKFLEMKPRKHHEGTGFRYKQADSHCLECGMIGPAYYFPSSNSVKIYPSCEPHEL